jgi:16S rRNA (guanine527-N7)-methyltransferase
MVESGIYGRVRDQLAALGLEPGDDARSERLATFVREVALWSGRIHLVGKRQIRQTLIHLFVDSWLMYLFARETGILSGGGNRVADVGSGAGFPGVLWKIVDQRLDLTLFEKREKSLRFLDRTVSRLGLDGIRVVGGDAKESDERGTFDIVLSKAAGHLIELSPIVSRLLRSDGFYLTVKGSGWRNEIDESVERLLRIEASRELPEERGEIVLFTRCEGHHRREE